MEMSKQTWDTFYGAIAQDKEANIIVRYHDDEYGYRPRLIKKPEGDWIDLYTAERCTLKQGQYGVISLGISIRLPDGYEAIIAPRSSTFTRYHVMMVNSIGIIDNAYHGDSDIWRCPVLAFEDTAISKDTCICQFRVLRNQPSIKFQEVGELYERNRNGFGNIGR